MKYTMKYTDEEKKRNREFKAKQEEHDGRGLLHLPLDGVLLYGLEKYEGKWFVTNTAGERVYEASSLQDALYTQHGFSKRYATRRDETMWGCV